MVKKQRSFNGFRCMLSVGAKRGKWAGPHHLLDRKEQKNKIVMPAGYEQ